MPEDAEQLEEQPSWYDRVRQSWLINTIVIPLAISFISAYCLHWMR